MLPAGTREAPITWKVPWAQGRQKRPGLSLVQHAGGAGPTLALLLTSCTYRFGWEGVRGWKHAPDLLVGVLMPSLVWISGHGCVVQGLKVHSFHADWPINARLSHYFICSSARSQGFLGPSLTNACTGTFQGILGLCPVLPCFLSPLEPSPRLVPACL